MAQKGQQTTADYLPVNELQKLFAGLHKDGLYKWEAYCKVSYCTAFRISDVRTTCWREILGKDELIKVEQKTQKARLVKLNLGISKNIAEMYELVGCPDVNLSVICNPETQEPYTPQYINRMLKRFRVRYQIRIKRFSTHSFRKAFARNMFEENGGTMKILSLIQTMLNHKNPHTTLAYMGYVQEDIDTIYDSLHF